MLKSAFSTLVFVMFGVIISHAQQSVKISGISEDMKDNHISVRWPPNFATHERKISVLSQQGSKTGEFTLGFNISKPEILIFGAYYKNWLIYFKPGESVTFKISGKGIEQKLVFFGREANRHNLDVMISDMINSAPAYHKNEDPNKFKAAIDKWKKESEAVLKTYLVKYGINKEIGSLSLSKLQYKYVQSIYSALSYLDKKNVPVGYFSEATKYSFAQDLLLSLIEYRTAIFYKYIASKASLQSLESIYKSIESELKGKTRDFALSYLAGEYAMKELPSDSKVLRKLFNKLYTRKLDNAYLSYLKDNEMRYFIVGKPLPDSVLNNTLLTSYGDDRDINLAHLLLSHKDKGVYIDLWASWCFPCRDDISKSSGTKRVLNEHKISYLYFSTDTDKRAWKKASEQDKITDNQYLLKNNKYSQFKSFLELSGIPRYIILDKNHNVVSLYAPSPNPSHAETLEKVITKISSKE